jgi:hypothetical protein
MGTSDITQGPANEFVEVWEVFLLMTLRSGTLLLQMPSPTNTKIKLL